MPDSVGTRSQQTSQHGRIDQGSETRSHGRDVGMSKRVVTTATFTASSAQIAGSNGDFAAFAVNDKILVDGTNLNNGFKIITGLDVTNQAYVTVDPAPKDESAVSGTIVRAA